MVGERAEGRQGASNARAWAVEWRSWRSVSQEEDGRPCALRARWIVDIFQWGVIRSGRRQGCEQSTEPLGQLWKVQNASECGVSGSKMEPTDRKL